MNLNPIAVIFWVFLAGLGFLFSGTLTGTVVGLVVGLGISLLVSMLPGK